MKKIICAIMLMAMTIMMSVSLVGCKDPEPDVIKPDEEVEDSPKFPEKIVANVSAGEKFVFTIEPNLDWELSIPVETAAYFKLLDGSTSRYTLYGEAGKHEITIQVAEKEEFDTPRVCIVTLKMGDEEQVIAELTRGAKERTAAVYACEFNQTDEMFVEDSEGNWSYQTTPMESFDFVWCNNQWMQRLVVETNFKWVLQECPESLLITTIDENGSVAQFYGTGNIGRTELFVRINNELRPLEDLEFEFKICDNTDLNGDGMITDEDIRVFKSLSGTIDGCNDECEIELSAAIEFDSNGMYYQSMSDVETEYVFGTVTAPYGIKIMKLSEAADGSVSADQQKCDWLTITEEEWPNDAQNIGLWSHRFSIAAAENNSISDRKALVVILPKAVAAKVTSADDLVSDGAIKQEYTDYVASTITQKAIVLENDTIEAYDEGAMTAYNAKFEVLGEGMWPWMNDWASIANGYKLTYKNNDSGSELIFNVPFARYEVYGFDGPSAKYDDLENCWIDLVQVPNPRDIEHCYKINMRLSDKYPNPLAGPDGENEATIVFYDSNDTPYALIYCILDPTFSSITGAEGDVVFVDPIGAAGKGAKLEEIIFGDDDYDTDMAAHGTLQYRLTLNPNCKEIELKMPEYGMVYSYNGAIESELASDETTTIVRVNSDVSTTGNISYYKANDSSYTIGIQIHCIYVVE